MKPLLARTARGAVPGAPTSFRIFYRDDVLTLDERELGALRRTLLSPGQRRNRVAPKVADELIELLWRKATGDRAREHGHDEFAHTMRGSDDFIEFARSWWPVVDAVDVYGWLRDPSRLAADAGTLLRKPEIDDLLESLTGDFSVEDVPLLDELRYLVGEPPEPEPEDDPLADLYDETVPELSTTDQRSSGGFVRVRPGERPTVSIEDDGYAHVLVDEAQDLSPMQWRMVGRRGRHASWTVVGDAAQSSWSRPDEAAAAREDALRGKDHNAFRLTTNYRNSQEIYELAAEVARAAIPGADLAVAVRETGVEPRIHDVDHPQLARTVREATEHLADQLDGTIGVVAPADRLDEVRAWLGERDTERIVVLEPIDTKGLEFDGLVVVEADAIVAESDAGIRTLYVVLTRATQQLEIVGTTNHWRP